MDSVRGDPFITFAERGRMGLKIRPKCEFSKGGCVNLVVLISPDREQGGGGPKSRKFCERNKWMPPYSEIKKM